MAEPTSSTCSNELLETGWLPVCSMAAGPAWFSEHGDVILVLTDGTEVWFSSAAWPWGGTIEMDATFVACEPLHHCHVG